MGWEGEGMGGERGRERLGGERGKRVRKGRGEEKHIGAKYVFIL